MKAAAFIGVSKGLLHDSFFLFAVARQQLVFYFFLVGKDNQSNQKHYNKAKYNTDTSANGCAYRSFIIGGFVREVHSHTICKTTRNNKAVFRTDKKAGNKTVNNSHNACHNNIAT